MAWADARAMPVRLHVLVWHTSLAAWVAGAVNSGTWDDIIDAHIDGVLSHYPGRAWDVEVANEVFDTGETDGFRTRSGIRRPAARTTSPTPLSAPGSTAARHAKLFLAEFGIEQADGAAKRDLLLTAVEDWLSQDVPIDGVSLQSHLQCDEALDKLALRRFIKDLQGMGLEVAVTEFDFRDIASLGMSDANAFAFIGQYARDYLRLVLNAGVRTIVAWGVAPEDWAATGLRADRGGAIRCVAGLRRDLDRCGYEGDVPAGPDCLADEGIGDGGRGRGLRLLILALAHAQTHARRSSVSRHRLCGAHQEPVLPSRL